jgi:hypothetical protein
MKTKLKKATAPLPALPGASSPTSQGEYRRVPLDQIQPSPFQARKTFEQSPDWREFVASVQTSGVVQPGVGRAVNGHIELVCGERRLRASQELGLPDMPLLVHTAMSDAEAQEIVQIENLQREGLNEIEEAEGYANWINRLTTGIGPDEDGNGKEQPPQCATRREAIEYIASRIQRQRATIYERLRLTELTKEEAQLLTSGQISASVASLLPTIPDPKARAKLVQEWSGRLDWDEEFRPTVRQVQREIENRFCKPLREAPFKLDVEYAGKAGPIVTCEACPQRSGNMLEQFPALKARPNVCTNPTCFKMKVAAAAALVVAKATEGGKATLTLKEFRARKAEFVDGNKTVLAQNRWGNNWEQCMGKHAPDPVLVATPDGVLKVYPKEEALSAIKKNGVKLSTSAGQAPEEREKAEQARKAVCARREELVKQLIPELVAKLKKLKADTAWSLVLALMQEDIYGDNLNLQIKGGDDQLRALAIVFESREPVEHSGDWSKDALAWWKRAGVDLLAAEKKALEEEKKKAKAPDEFVQQLLGLAKKAGFKPLVDQLSVITNCAARHDLPDIEGCQTDEQRQALLKAFRAECEVIIKAKGKTKPTKTKAAKAGRSQTAATAKTKKGKKK